MTLLAHKKEVVDFIGAVAATLPSPMKRCQLHFNPFLDTTRPRCFRKVAYNSPEKFQRVKLEDSNNNYPSEFHFRRNISITTSGDSTWDFNSLASFSEDVHHTMGSSCRNSSSRPEHGRPSDRKDVMEAPCVAVDDDEIRPLAPNRRSSRLVDVQPASRKTVSAESNSVHPMLTSPRSVAGLSKSDGCETSNVRKLPKDKADEEMEKQGKEDDVQERELEGGSVAKNTSSPLNFVRKITPDFREGLAIIKRLTGNANGGGSETPKNDRTEKAVLPPSESAARGTRGDEEADRGRKLSKTGSLRKMLSLRTGDNNESPRRQPLRKLLRKTSKTLTNIFEFGRSVEADIGRVNNCTDSDNAAANGESHRGLKKKYSTSMGNTAMKRGIEEFAKVEKRGSTSEPASLSSRTNGNQFGERERESIEQHLNEVFGKDFLKHAVDVERYLDDLATP